MAANLRGPKNWSIEYSCVWNWKYIHISYGNIARSYFFYVKLLIIELKQKYEPYICQFFVTIDAKYYLPFSINIDIRILLSVFGVVYRLICIVGCLFVNETLWHQRTLSCFQQDVLSPKCCKMLDPSLQKPEGNYMHISNW